MKYIQFNMVKAVAAIILMGAFSTANAVQVAETTITISSIRTSENTGNVYIYPVETVEELNGSCDNLSGYSIDKNYELFNQIYSSLLTAATSGKKVDIWVSLEDNDCINQFQKIRVVEILFNK